MDTLQKLEDSDWGDPSPEDTRMVQRCMDLRRKPVSEFSDEDLRLMIGQQIGNDHLIPIAIGVVEANPLASGDMFEGALIENITRIDADWWAAHPDQESRFRSIIDRIDWNDDFAKGVRRAVESWIDSHTIRNHRQATADSPRS